MDYVEWVERVLFAIAHRYEHPEIATEMLSYDFRHVAQMLELDSSEPGPVIAVSNALQDLERWGLLQETSSGHRYEPTQIALTIAADGSLSEAWPWFFADSLTGDQAQFLKQVVAATLAEGDAFASVIEVTTEDMHTAAGGKWSAGHHVTYQTMASRLADMGFLVKHSTLDQTKVRPTYAGVVHITRALESEWRPRIREWTTEGESANVDFKREIDLVTASGKAKVIKHILGIATTKMTSVRRAIVIGLANATGEPVRSLPANITQDRVDRILHAYTDPTPRVQIVRVPWGTQEIGVVEFHRKPRDIPYRVSKSLGDKGGERINEGDIYVRHGSSTESPTGAELQTLIAEGERARAREE